MSSSCIIALTSHPRLPASFISVKHKGTEKRVGKWLQAFEEDPPSQLEVLGYTVAQFQKEAPGHLPTGLVPTLPYLGCHWHIQLENHTAKLHNKPSSHPKYPENTHNIDEGWHDKTFGFKRSDNKAFFMLKNGHIYKPTHFHVQHLREHNVGKDSIPHII